MARSLLITAIVTLAAATSLDAQSFGRNKVHYHGFDFRILETAHFDVYYYPAEADAAVQAGRLAERWYTRLSEVFDHTLSTRQPIVLYASHAQFTQTNVVPGFLDEGVGGVTEHEKGRVVLPFVWSLGETDHVLGHELVHAFQRDILRHGSQPLGTLSLWFVEGMAEYLSVGAIDPNTAMWLRDSVEQKRLPSIAQLEDPSWFPYRYGQALWTFVASTFGDETVAECLNSPARGGAVARLVAVTGVDEPTLSSRWQEYIRHAVQQTDDAAVAASSGSALPGSDERSRFNVGPAISPDGKTIAFFSDRDRYSIDLVIADTATGRVRRKAIGTRDPRFESLQFIESAAAWDASGRRLAVAALAGGRPAIAIVNAETGDVERQVAVPLADQVFSPTWSPDGRRIAVSILQGGFSNLAIVDLENGAVQQLTNDPFADLQPAWSPDGRRLAFSTDRFSSSMDTLTFGDFRLATIDVASRAIDALPGLPGAKHIDPHWSADGRAVYFVGDPDGISNVYRLDLESGAFFKVTNVSTGVSGVTRTSPALTVAPRGDRLAFSVYRGGKYRIQVMEGVAHSSSVDVSSARPSFSTVGTESRPRVLLDRPITPPGSLPDASHFTTRPYRAGLSLDRVFQPYVSAGGGGGGSFLRAGAGVSFGDMLGDHELQALFQVGKRADDFAAEAAYVNRRSRWNWGVSASQVPWLTGATTTQDLVGRDVVARRTQLFRQLHREIGAAAIYPLNVAERIELAASLQSIAYRSLTTTNEYSVVTGRLTRTATTASRALAEEILVQPAAAIVHDSSIFGPTSPILGRRYRFAVSPTLGGLRFITATADYRQYWMPRRPFTVAVRVMHLGRYGSDASDSRLLPLVWTVRDIVRGYGDRGIGSTSDGSLSSTRLVVANGEIRFPVSAMFGRSTRPSVLPVEGLIFSDSGRFWSAPNGATSMLLQSVGAGARLNAAGMIFEFDAVRRLAGPNRTWTFSINFRPGF